jgi:hypothetical protein
MFFRDDAGTKLMRKIKRVCPPSFQTPLPHPEGKFPFLPFHFEYAPNFNQSSPHQTWTKSTSQDSKRSATAAKELDTQGIEPWTDHKFAKICKAIIIPLNQAPFFLT